eukprot:g8148.t1
MLLLYVVNIQAIKLRKREDTATSITVEIDELQNSYSIKCAAFREGTQVQDINDNLFNLVSTLNYTINGDKKAIYTIGNLQSETSYDIYCAIDQTLSEKLNVETGNSGEFKSLTVANVDTTIIDEWLEGIRKKKKEKELDTRVKVTPEQRDASDLSKKKESKSIKAGNVWEKSKS